MRTAVLVALGACLAGLFRFGGSALRLVKHDPAEAWGDFLAFHARAWLRPVRRLDLAPTEVILRQALSLRPGSSKHDPLVHD
jgi:hypothetical protein